MCRLRARTAVSDRRLAVWSFSKTPKSRGEVPAVAAANAALRSLASFRPHEASPNAARGGERSFVSARSSAAQAGPRAWDLIAARGSESWRSRADNNLSRGGRLRVRRDRQPGLLAGTACRDCLPGLLAQSGWNHCRPAKMSQVSGVFTLAFRALCPASKCRARWIADTSTTGIGESVLGLKSAFGDVIALRCSRRPARKRPPRSFCRFSRLDAPSQRRALRLSGNNQGSTA